MNLACAGYGEKLGFGGSSSQFGVSFLKFSAALYLVRLDFSRLRSEHSVCRSQVGKKMFLE